MATYITISMARLIGQTAREALASVDSQAWVELHRDAWNDGRAA